MQLNDLPASAHRVNRRNRCCAGDVEIIAVGQHRKSGGGRNVRTLSPIYLAARKSVADTAPCPGCVFEEGKLISSLRRNIGPARQDKVRRVMGQRYRAVKMQSYRVADIPGCDRGNCRRAGDIKVIAVGAER